MRQSRSSQSQLTGGGYPPVHTIEIHGVPESLLQRLDERARASRASRSQVIQEILTGALCGGESDASGQTQGVAATSIDAALAPIRQGFAESGLNEEEITGLLDEGLRTVRLERRTGIHHQETVPQSAGETKAAALTIQNDR